MDNRRGCLSGLLEMFLLDRVFNWGQRRFGFGRGGCFGCGCGLLLLIMFLVLASGVIFNTNWFRIGF